MIASELPITGARDSSAERLERLRAHLAARRAELQERHALERRALDSLEAELEAIAALIGRTLQ